MEQVNEISAVICGGMSEIEKRVINKCSDTVKEMNERVRES